MLMLLQALPLLQVLLLLLLLLLLPSKMMMAVMVAMLWFEMEETLPGMQWLQCGQEMVGWL